MENINTLVLENAPNEVAKSEVVELNLSQLSLIGGGCGEVIFG